MRNRLSSVLSRLRRPFKARWRTLEAVDELDDLRRVAENLSLSNKGTSIELENKEGLANDDLQY